MEKPEMINTLTERAKVLAEELKKLEFEFNKRKEEFLKVQGALEALNELSDPLTP